ncbi:MAG: GTPase HflX, partial [Bryobacteraceae bacterium]
MERAILVGLDLKPRRTRARASLDGADYSPEESLQELAALAESAGAEIIGSTMQRRARPEPDTLIGSGKVEEIARWVQAEGADLVIFDHDLTPSQHRNLEDALGCKVVDRTQLILDIFARRARTREGQLQVELAQ